MEKISSFTIDHNKLQRGIYVARKDATSSGDVITTFDIRMTEPNRQAALCPKALHTIEHLAATYLRNHPLWKERIVYWGPMGCCTGNYLIIKGDLRSYDIVPLITEVMEFIAKYNDDIPGATPVECGNYTFMNLEEAKRAARKFLDEILYNISSENLTYP